MGPEWLNNEIKNPYFFDGDIFVVAVKTNNGWDIDRIRAIADEDRLDWVYDQSGESYDAWTWEDVEFYIPISADGPVSAKQMRGME